MTQVGNVIVEKVIKLKFDYIWLYKALLGNTLYIIWYIIIWYILFGLSHSPAKFKIKPEVPNGHDRDRNKISQILILI